MRILVATGSRILWVDPGREERGEGDGLEGRAPTCLAAAQGSPGGRHGRAWCGTRDAGVLVSDDGGATWRSSSLAGERIMALAASPTEPGVMWAGSEPSALWRSADGGTEWRRVGGFERLPSSVEWAFPPRPDTHHVRWIAPHPLRAGRLWLAIEAGALITTPDGGATWMDRVPGGPRDTHEIAIHPERPGTLRIAAGDGFFESANGGASWSRPMDGLDVGYLRSIAVDPGDPDVVVVSGASRPRSAYVAGRSDGRLYRKSGAGAWERVVDGWPERPETIAPLLAAGTRPGELWAADERGLHRSEDGGRSWQRLSAFDPTPSHLRGLAVLG